MRCYTVALLLCWTALALPVRVIDGDTFVADVRIWPDLTSRERVRVLGVNTPELRGPHREKGEEARAFTELWLKDTEVRLQVCRRDAFGRALATVIRTHDGRNLTLDLIDGGYGQPHK